MLCYRTSININILLIYVLKLLSIRSWHWCLSILPEIHQKNKGFLMISGVQKETSAIKWIKSHSISYFVGSIYNRKISYKLKLLIFLINWAKVMGLGQVKDNAQRLGHLKVWGHRRFFSLIDKNISLWFLHTSSSLTSK